MNDTAPENRPARLRAALGGTGTRALAALGLAALMLGFGDTAPVRADLISEVTGKTWNVRGRVNGTVTYNSDGSASYRTRLGLTGTGAWRRQGTQMCVRWFNFAGGRERCFDIERAGANTYSTSVGLTLYR